MRRRRWPVRRCINGKKLWLIALFAGMLVLLYNSYVSLEELVAVYGENRCRNLVTQLLLDTVYETQTAGKLSYFTSIDNNSIIQLNSTAIRQYQAIVGKTVAQKLNGLEEQTHRVPLGTVLENAFFMERGPALPVRFAPIGSAAVDIRSTLADSGINQVLYRVTMTVSVEMTVLLPGESRTVLCEQDFILEEVLLTGEVPLLYGG